VKKIMFSYFTDVKRSGNIGRKKRWNVRIQNDLELCEIKNWMRLAHKKDHRLALTNRHVQLKPVHDSVKRIINDYRQRAEEWRSKVVAVRKGVI
jgi:hypothetical protein